MARVFLFDTLIERNKQLKRGICVTVKEVIVVEGKNDSVKIKQAVDAYTIETNGSAISEETLTMIKHANEKRGVIIFTDPDYPGMRIRHIIDEAVPGCKHAFLTQDEATAKTSRKNLGIENASLKTIKKALERVYNRTETTESYISRSDLIAYKLIGHKRAKQRRKQLGDLLRIGYTNGKQLLNRLNMFQITKNELEQAIQHIIEEERRTDYVK